MIKILKYLFGPLLFINATNLAMFFNSNPSDSQQVKFEIAVRNSPRDYRTYSSYDKSSNSKEQTRLTMHSDRVGQGSSRINSQTTSNSLGVSLGNQPTFSNHKNMADHLGYKALIENTNVLKLNLVEAQNTLKAYEKIRNSIANNIVSGLPIDTSPQTKENAILSDGQIQALIPTIQKLESTIASLEKCITYNESLLAKFNAEITQATQKYAHSIENMSTHELVSKEIPRLEVERTRAMGEADALKVHAQIEYAQNLMQQRLTAENAQLTQVQKVISNLEARSMLADPQLKGAINLTKFDEGKPRYSAKIEISPNTKTVLTKHNIPHQKFESMTSCTALQKCLHERTGIMINEVADIATKFAADSKIQTYTQAAIQHCDLAVDIIKTGSPAQAIAATKFASIWHLLAHLEAKMDVGIIKGIPAGIIISAALTAAPQIAMPVLAVKLAYDVACVGLYVKDGGLAKSFEDFNKLTPDQQLQRLEQFAENYGTFVGGFLTAGPQISEELNSTIVASTKALKTELIGLQAIAKTEQVELAGLKGITAPKQFAQELNGLAQAGKITTQANVQGYILAKQAPALCTFVESEAIGSTHTATFKVSQLDQAGMTAKMGSVDRKVASELSFETKVAHEVTGTKSEVANASNVRTESKVAGELAGNKNATTPGSNVEQKIANETVKKYESSHTVLPKEGCVIDGRYYTKHGLERMAPDTPQIRAELERRAIDLGYSPQHSDPRIQKKYYDYIQPRDIPPSVVEHTISMSKATPGENPGTWLHKFNNVTIVTNNAGIVVTVRRGN
jgi:hypothetical protein